MLNHLTIRVTCLALAALSTGPFSPQLTAEEPVDEVTLTMKMVSADADEFSIDGYTVTRDQKSVNIHHDGELLFAVYQTRRN